MNIAHIAPLLLCTGIALGLGAPIAKAAAQHGVNPLAFALWPTLAAGLLLGALGLLRQGRPADLPRLLRFGGVAGLFGHALPMSALFWLSSHAGAGFASLSLALPPVFTLMISVLVGLERLALRRGTAVGLGLSGALLMLAGRGGSFEATPAVLALSLAIPASIGAANVYRSRHMPPGASGEWMSASTLLASSSMLAFAGLAFGGIALPVSASAIAWLALQAVVLTVGYLVYFALQRRADPVTFSFIGYVMMLAGVTIGTFAFGERLPWTVWPAAALVLAALLLLQPSTAAPAPSRMGDTLGRAA
jgi:drug/metabolite transporter (DMT)-like permease